MDRLETLDTVLNHLRNEVIRNCKTIEVKIKVEKIINKFQEIIEEY